MADNTKAGESASKQQQMEEEKEELRFVNQGLQLWEHSRTQWLGHQRQSDDDNNNSATAESNSHSSQSTPRPAAVPIEVDEIIEVVFAVPRQDPTDGGGPKAFPRSVPLPQMVDILVDLWEAEGLDI